MDPQMPLIRSANIFHILYLKCCVYSRQCYLCTQFCHTWCFIFSAPRLFKLDYVLVIPDYFYLFFSIGKDLAPNVIYFNCSRTNYFYAAPSFVLPVSLVCHLHVQKLLAVIHSAAQSALFLRWLCDHTFQFCNHYQTLKEMPIHLQCKPMTLCAVTTYSSFQQRKKKKKNQISPA